MIWMFCCIHMENCLGKQDKDETKLQKPKLKSIRNVWGWRQ